MLSTIKFLGMELTIKSYDFVLRQEDYWYLLQRYRFVFLSIVKYIILIISNYNKSQVNNNYKLYFEWEIPIVRTARLKFMFKRKNSFLILVPVLKALSLSRFKRTLLSMRFILEFKVFFLLRFRWLVVSVVLGEL